MKVRGVGEGAVTRPTGRREYVHVGSAAAIPAADAYRSSNRTLFGTGIFTEYFCISKNLISKFLQLKPKNQEILAGRGFQPRPKRFDFGRSKPKCLGQTETWGQVK